MFFQLVNAMQRWAHHPPGPDNEMSRILWRKSALPCTFRSRSNTSSTPLVLRTAGVTPNPSPWGFSSTPKVRAASDHHVEWTYLLRFDERLSEPTDNKPKEGETIH